MWGDTAECIRRLAKEILCVSRGGSAGLKGAWWQNEEVKEKVKDKREGYKALVSCGAEKEKEVNRVRYKTLKKEAKKAISLAKNNDFETLYQRLDLKKGEKEV